MTHFSRENVETGDLYSLMDQLVDKATLLVCVMEGCMLVEARWLFGGFAVFISFAGLFFHFVSFSVLFLS